MADEVETRFANRDWLLADRTGPGRGALYPHMKDSVSVAVLMDIRDELRKLNARLNCWEFTTMPAVLRRIDKRLAKHAPLQNRRGLR